MASDSERAKKRPIRVLLAEDDPDVRDSISELLVLEGYLVESVSTGADLMRRLSSFILEEEQPQPDGTPDVIVTDVRMPGFNGLNIVEGLRQSGFRQPIVVMTAFSDDATKKRVERMGKARLIAKPFDPAVLEKALEALVS